jgi:hypothetical protein
MLLFKCNSFLKDFNIKKKSIYNYYKKYNIY